MGGSTGIACEAGSFFIFAPNFFIALIFWNRSRFSLQRETLDAFRAFFSYSITLKKMVVAAG